ncbi:MAG: fatty acid desaturase family protein [Rickettsiales bacterium]
MVTMAGKGEEFRDDERRRTGLPPDVVKRLTRIDPFRSWLGVGETVGLLALAIGAGAYWWTPWAVVPALIVIAGRQQACFVLAHDAAHYRLFRARWLNDLVGRMLAAPVGLSMRTYRVVHRLHHNHLYEAQDPDIPLVAGYPRGRKYLARKLLADLLGLNAWKTYAYFFGAPAINDDAAAANRPLDDTAPDLRRAARRDRWSVVGFHVAAPIAAFAAGYLVEYLVLWLLPMLTIQQPLLRYRAIAEHGAVTDFSSPLTAARTNFAPWWLHWWMFPHNVSYHVEHHLYPSIPFYNLPECHRELARHGLLEHAEVRRLGETHKLFVADPKGAD